MKNSFVVGLGALAVAWAGMAFGESRLLTFKCGVAGESLTKAQDNNGVHYWTSDQLDGRGWQHVCSSG